MLKINSPDLYIKMMSGSITIPYLKKLLPMLPPNTMGYYYLSNPDFSLRETHYVVLSIMNNQIHKDEIESLGASFDLHWVKQNKKTIFIPTDILQWLGTCKFDVDIHSLIKNTHGSCAFAFESNGLYHNNQVFPFIYGGIESDFFFLRKMPDSEIWDSQRLSVCFNTDGGEEFIGDAHKADISNIKARQCISIIVAVESYIKAFPESLRSGPPRPSERIECASQFYLTRPRDQKIIGSHGSPCAHWRRGHFRELRDDRFKKNNDGSNRIVFVHDCIVSQKGQEIYTVEDPKA